MMLNIRTLLFDPTKRIHDFAVGLEEDLMHVGDVHSAIRFRVGSSPPISEQATHSDSAAPPAIEPSVPQPPHDMRCKGGRNTAADTSELSAVSSPPQTLGQPLRVKLQSVSE